MLLSCPNCGTITKVADVMIPSARLTATCSGCGVKIGGTVPSRLHPGPSGANPGGGGRSSESRRKGPSGRPSDPKATGSESSGGESPDEAAKGMRAGGKRRTRSSGANEKDGIGLRPPDSGEVAEGGTRTVARGLDPERLARLIASDMLLYNRDKVQGNAPRGRLLSSMAADILEAWEFYKRRVGVHTALGTSYFRDALNEILAGGDPVI